MQKACGTGEREGRLGIQGPGPTRAVENNADKKKKLIDASLKTNSNTDYTKCNVGRNEICDNKLKMLLLNARSIVKMEKRLELQAQARILCEGLEAIP